ncbi:MAG: hypothetical protein IPO98_21875 [Saprospiraceae bacterium]|nr:hypothetical protein [Saprospiraceae bacterium]
MFGFAEWNFNPTIGSDTNNTGAAINGFTNYKQLETWRWTASRSDSLKFQYKDNTTAIDGMGNGLLFPLLDYSNPAA